MQTGIKREGKTAAVRERERRREAAPTTPHASPEAKLIHWQVLWSVQSLEVAPAGTMSLWQHLRPPLWRRLRQHHRQPPQSHPGYQPTTASGATPPARGVMAYLTGAPRRCLDVVGAAMRQRRRRERDRERDSNRHRHRCAAARSKRRGEMQTRSRMLHAYTGVKIEIHSDQADPHLISTVLHNTSNTECHIYSV
jgi:hypothetical protein